MPRNGAKPDNVSKAEIGSNYKNLKAIIQQSTISCGYPRRSVTKMWPDYSMVNYMPAAPEDESSGSTRQSVDLPTKERSVENVLTDETTVPEILEEKFPVNVTRLMNEDNHWGTFYIEPELYKDVYSPVVRIRNVDDVPELEEGVLTRDMVSACLSYLKRTPILGEYAFIKLNLSSKRLCNIDVLKQYKYLVYLDLSSNLLTELTVLSYLPYLQYLTVAYNNLNTVLEYDTAQWFLSEVHYRYNFVKKINDLTAFWSITVLDLSHNNIKSISGLEKLMYLRRLDLSFNHIQRLENLNHLCLLWLDVSYNNISSFEMGEDTGLWTLLHLEYLNLNENNLTSMRMFADCTRLSELHARNNRFFFLLEIAVYMKELRRLVVMDLRENPVCSAPGYKDAIVNTFPLLLSLDAAELDPIEQRSLKMDMFPDATVHATRRLHRLLYIQHLSRASVSPFVPPADTTDVPIIIIVGHEAVGKGQLVRRIASECSSNVELARRHTTATHHLPDHFIEITRQKFDDLILAGDLLTYSELGGESYGLTREEAFVKNGKVKIVAMDLVGALMMKLRGYRPYIILATMRNNQELIKKQLVRRSHLEDIASNERSSIEVPCGTLHVLLSGRIIITGILNEILMDLPDEKKEASDFLLESECSLMMDSELRKTLGEFARDSRLIALLTSNNLSMDEIKRFRERTNQDEQSLYSLFKESQITDEFTSYAASGQGSYQKSEKSTKVRQSKIFQQNKSIDFSRYASSTWKGNTTGNFSTVPTQRSSKSVTFTPQDGSGGEDPSGLLIEAPPADSSDDKIRSVSVKAPWPAPGQHAQHGPQIDINDSDLWLAFLTEARQREASETCKDQFDTTPKQPKDDTSLINVTWQRSVPNEGTETLERMETLSKALLRDDYESVHRRNPGLFWDTVTMDDADAAFKKLRRIIRDIIERQKTLKPMFNIDFTKETDYPMAQEKLESIRKQIAPQQLFY